MKVKNIKSFIEFYKSLGITTCISQSPRIQKKNTRNKQNIKKKIFPAQEPENFIILKSEKIKKLLIKVNNLDCNLKDIASNLVFSDGNQNSEIMLIGDAPGGEEDRSGKPFVGQAGKLLDKMLGFIDLDRTKNFYITNLVFWRPPGNRTPNSHEIKTCLSSTRDHISIIKPKLLIFLGNIAAKSLLKSEEGITKLRGKDHLYIDEEAKIKIPAKAIFHPAYLLRNPIEKKRIWDDLLEINSYLLKNKIKF
jgi:DNA polymerase